MPDIAAVFFDMDGTLVHTADANFAAYATALAEVGIIINRADFDALAHAQHWKQFLPAMLAGTQIDPLAVACRKRILYPGMMALTRVNGHVLGLANAMRTSRGIGLVTTASMSSVSAVLSEHGLSTLFDVVVSGDDVERPKPAPEAYHLAAARLGVDPRACLAVEDSDAGVASARCAGMGVLRIESACFSD